MDDPILFARALQSWRNAVTEQAHLPRYRVVQRLGEGSQGLVYSVADRDCLREVALKTLHAHQCAADDVSRFIHEAQITAQLEHPGIVPVHDLDVLPDGTVFYTMKKVEGRTLADLLEDTSRPDHAAIGAHVRPRPQVEDLLQILLKVCDTVAFAHSRSVIHRDLKLRNLMVGRYGEVLVMDWGLAKVLDGGSDSTGSGPRQVQSLRTLPIDDGNDIHQTMQGCAVGTPAYMSPEQARGEPADRRSDLYSLGVVLYVCLCGESPYERGRVKYTLEQAASGHWQRLDHQELGRVLSKRLVAIVHKCMAFDAVDRYQTADALAVDLRAYLAGHAVGAYRDTPLDRGLRFIAQQWRGLAIAAGVMAMLGVAMLAWNWHAQSLRAQQIQALRRLSAQHELMGEFDEARRDCEQILISFPDDRAALDGLQRLRQALARRGDEQLALRRRQDAAGLVRQAVKLVEAGDDDSLRRATESYLGALGLMPGDPTIAGDYRRTMAMIAGRDEQVRSAVRAADQRTRAKELTVRSTEAEARGDMRQAIGSLEAALQLDPTDERTKHHALLVAKAVELDRVAEVRAHQAEAAELMRVCRQALATGDTAGARLAFDNARSVDADHPELPQLGRAVQDLEQARINDQARLLLRTVAHHRVQIRTLDGLLEDRAVADVQTKQRERATHLGAALQLLYQAQALAPQLREVRVALAEYYLQRMVDGDVRRSKRPQDSGFTESDIDEDASETHAEATAAAIACDDEDVIIAVAGSGRVEVRGAEVLCHRLIHDVPAPMSAGLPLAAGSISTLAWGHWLMTDQAGQRAQFGLQRGQHLVIDWPPMIPADQIFVPATAVTVVGTAQEVPAFYITDAPLTVAALQVYVAGGGHLSVSLNDASKKFLCSALSIDDLKNYATWLSVRDGLFGPDGQAWRLPRLAEVRAFGSLEQPVFACLDDGTAVVALDDRFYQRVHINVGPATTVPVTTTVRLVRAARGP